MSLKTLNVKSPNYFRAGSLPPLGLNPRFEVPNKVRDFTHYALSAPFLHRTDCYIHLLLDIGDDSDRPPSPAVSLAPFSTVPFVDDIVDAFSLLVRDQHLQCFAEADRISIYSDFQHKAQTIIQGSLNGSASQEELKTMLIRGQIFLTSQVINLAISSGMCTCKVRKEESILSGDRLGREIFFPIVLPTGPAPTAGLNPLDLIPRFKDQMAFNCYVSHEQCAGMNLYRNKVMKDRPIPVRFEHRNDVLAFYQKFPIQPHVPTPKQNPLLVPVYFENTSAPSSIKAIDQMEEVLVEDIHCPFRYGDTTCAIVRVLTEPVIFGLGIKFMVEDRKGNSIPLTVEFPLPRPSVYYRHSLLEELYPIGAVLGVKEPHVRFSPNMMLPEICVSIPTDIVEYHSDGPVTWDHPSPIGTLKSATDYKELGNAIAAKDPLLASVYYTRGLLSCTDPALRLALLLNRSQMALDTGRPGAAWRDCIAVDELEGVILSHAQQHKLLYRKMKAAGDLEMFEVALKLAEKGIKEGVQHSEKVKMDVGCKQAESGGREWPVVVKDSPGQGHGTFLTRDVLAGEVVLNEPAFVHVEYDPQTPYSFLSFPDDTAFSQRSDNTWWGLCKMIHLIIDDPRKSDQIADLWPRTTTPKSSKNRLETPIDGQESIDPVLIFRKEKMNSSGAELEGSGNPAYDFLGRPTGGLHLHPRFSGLNHSCMPNTMITKSDAKNKTIMVLVDLKAGDELFTHYIDPTSPYSERTGHLKKNWGIDCKCALCLEDRADDHSTRATLMRKDWPAVQNGSWKLLKEFAKRVEKTYKPGRVFKVEIAQVWLQLLSHREAKKSMTPEEMVRMTKDILIACGVKVCTTEEENQSGKAFKSIPAVDLSILVTNAVAVLRQAFPGISKTWESAAKWMVNTLELARDELGMKNRMTTKIIGGKKMLVVDGRGLPEMDRVMEMVGAGYTVEFDPITKEPIIKPPSKNSRSSNDMAEMLRGMSFKK